MSIYVGSDTISRKLFVPRFCQDQKYRILAWEIVADERDTYDFKINARSFGSCERMEKQKRVGEVSSAH